MYRGAKRIKTHYFQMESNQCVLFILQQTEAVKVQFISGALKYSGRNLSEKISEKKISGAD